MTFRPPRRSVIRVLVLASLLVLVTAVHSALAADPATLWVEAELPGSLRGLASVADLRPEALTPERLMPELIRVLYHAPVPRGRVAAYVAALSRLRWFVDQGRPLHLAMASSADGERRLRIVLEALGLVRTTARGRQSHVVVDPSELAASIRAALALDGIPSEEIADRLNRGSRVDLVVPSVKLPLPMSRAWWQAAFGRPDVVAAAFERPEAALMLYGMLSVEAQTRAYFSTRPGLANAFFKANPQAFALYIGHLRVRNGRIDVPGGQEAEPFWEALVGQKVGQPHEFMHAVLATRAGRLAYLYSVVDALDVPRARFVTGTWMPAAAAAEHLRNLATSFDRSVSVTDPSWSAQRSPFARPNDDPSLLLAQVAVKASGELIGPAWRYLWSVVFESGELPERSDRELKWEPGLFSPSFLLERVFVTSSRAESRVRALTFLFGQRVFADAQEADAPHILLALRGFMRFPMLGLTLERMGIRDALTHSVAVRRARDLHDISNPKRAAAAIAQFQGAVALLERAVRSRRLSGSEAARLVRSLVGLPLDRDGSYGASVAVWLQRELIPRVAALAPDPSEDVVEPRLLAGLSGLSIVVAPDDARVSGPIVEWEGARYRTNPAPALFDRVTRIRAQQGGYTADFILEVLVLRSALSSLPGREDLARVIVAAARLQHSARKATRSPSMPAVDGAIDEILSILRAIRSEKQLKNAARALAPLEELLELLTTEWLRSVLYALAIPSANTPLLAGGDISFQHELGLAGAGRQVREQVAWRLPSLDADTSRTKVTGSLFGLDLAFGEVALKQVTGLRPPTANNRGWSDEARQVLLQSLALFDPFVPTASEMDAVAVAIAAGRARVTALPSRPDDVSAVAKAAGLSPLRRADLERAVERDPPRAARLFSLAELLRISGHDEARAAGERWGSSSYALNGCLCLAHTPSADFEFFGGREGARGFLGALVSDPLLRLAEDFSRMKLPPALAGDVLPNMLQTVLDDSPILHTDDWFTIVAHVSSLPDYTIQDYVSLLLDSKAMSAMIPLSFVE